MLKTLLMGLAGFAALFIAVMIAGPIIDHQNTALGIALLLVLFVAMMWGIIKLSDFLDRPWRPKTYGPTLEELRSQGLTKKTSYKAIRAVEIEEGEDEGLHFFLELENGSLLFLSGQYLYDFVGEDADEDVFPCTKITIERGPEGAIYDTQFGGKKLLYGALPSTYWLKSRWKDDMPQDGDIITDVGFDELTLD